MRRSSRKRRGVGITEMAVVVAVVLVVAVVVVGSLGTNASNDMNQTAAEVADPAALTDRFSEPSP